MANKVKFGLSEVHIAPITSITDGVYTYGTIFAIPGAVNLTLDRAGEEENFYAEHVSNVRLRTLILPYILPIGISILLILGYYAIRFKGTKEMIGLIKYLVIFEGLLYSSLALCRIPFGIFTMPIALIIYLGVVVIYTAYNENKTNA